VKNSCSSSSPTKDSAAQSNSSSIHTWVETSAIPLANRQSLPRIVSDQVVTLPVWSAGETPSVVLRARSLRQRAVPARSYANGIDVAPNEELVLCARRGGWATVRHSPTCNRAVTAAWQHSNHPTVPRRLNFGNSRFPPRFLPRATWGLPTDTRARPMHHYPPPPHQRIAHVGLYFYHHSQPAKKQ